MIIRAESNLDEQLHAGSYFYFPTTKFTYQSSSIYMYPIILCLVGYFIPQIINYSLKSLKSETFYETTIYFLVSHMIGLVHLLLPCIIERFYSLFINKNSKFHEELPEPLADTNNTKYVFFCICRW